MGLLSTPIVIDVNRPTLSVLSTVVIVGVSAAGGVGARCDFQILAVGVAVADDGVAVGADRDRRVPHD